MKAEHADGRAMVSGAGEVRRMEVRRIVNAPIERVWHAITDARQVEHWWAPGEIDPREGGRIRLEMGDDCGDGAAPLDGLIKVFQPPYVFEYSWNETDAAANPGSGVVRFDLVALDSDRTLVTLTNFVLARDLVVVAVGWHELVERLDAAVTTGNRQPENPARTAELFELYAAELGS